MTYKDYYQILGLNKTASADQVKKAYRKLAMQYHPDHNHGKEEWSNEKFKDINEAFSILGDPEKKLQYDQFGTVGTFDDILGSQVTRETFEELIQDFGEAGLDLGFFDDILGGTSHSSRFTYRKFGRGFGSSKSTRFHVPEDVELEDIGNNQSFSNYYVDYVMSLSSEQAAKGIEKELRRNGKKLNVKIPANIRNGGKIRLKNALKLTDGKPGDIMILVKIE
ncbi:MAG: DnaJ domain-containing protein [Dehalococcoidales bacterium]|nr:MAG: DnaJ domain-containing protein [Dehalococcoidales bacterium]